MIDLMTAPWKVLYRAAKFFTYVALVTLLVETMISYIIDYIELFSAGQLIRYFGLTTALSVFLKILITGWGFKSILTNSSK